MKTHVVGGFTEQANLSHNAVMAVFWSMYPSGSETYFVGARCQGKAARTYALAQKSLRAWCCNRKHRRARRGVEFSEGIMRKVCLFFHAVSSPSRYGLSIVLVVCTYVADPCFFFVVTSAVIEAIVYSGCKDCRASQ